MRISRKYPLFLLITTMGTAGAVFFAIQREMTSSIEKEIIKRGESAAQSFAIANAPRVLSGNLDKLQYDLGALANDADVVNARIADHNGTIIASLAPKDVGKPIESVFTDPGAPPSLADPKAHAFHFPYPVRYGNTDLGTFVLSLSSDPLDNAVMQAQKRALIFALGIAAIISIFALLLVQREVRPLQEMSLKLGAIANGDFSQRVPETRRDEIGQLATAFNYMLKRAELFFHYVDRMIIDRLADDDSLTRPGGREKNLAVVFGDMRGYTSMSNRRSANEVVKIVNTYFHLFVECIAHFKGVVDKTMGDAIMAVFEQLASEEDPSIHRQRGMLSVAYMKAAQRVLNQLLRNRPDVCERLNMEPREFGFAVASGSAIVGNIGSKRRMDYTVCGRVVNLASRLEGLTKQGEVILDNFTFFDAGKLLTVMSLPPVQPKGFSDKERVVPHRLTGLIHPEAAKMKKFLNLLFSYTFVQEMLSPEDLPERERHKWCRGIQEELAGIVEHTPIEGFFAPAHSHKGELVPPPMASSAPGKKRRKTLTPESSQSKSGPKPMPAAGSNSGAHAPASGSPAAKPPSRQRRTTGSGWGPPRD